MHEVLEVKSCGLHLHHQVVSTPRDTYVLSQVMNPRILLLAVLKGLGFQRGRVGVLAD